ncbi:Uncharacterised protein [uncultured archaeon]|nr:Uncharacterised protein [uncultured archaeon]
MVFILIGRGSECGLEKKTGKKTEKKKEELRGRKYGKRKIMPRRKYGKNKKEELQKTTDERKRNQKSILKKKPEQTLWRRNQKSV